MTEVDIAGFGIWSASFADPGEFRAVLAGREVESEGTLKPELIPARERRRAPAMVKMAVEVMDQACKMADLDPAAVASVFGSGMGDMQITDYMCRTLATSPRAVSPTKFHNSVHNASTGYWSIATGSHCPANAVSAYANTVAATLLETSVQALEEDTPVLMAIEELAAPQPFKSVIEVDAPFAAALLLVPPGHSVTPLGSLSLALRPEFVDEPAPPALDDADFSNNFAATILPLLIALAEGQRASVSLPLSRRSTLDVTLEHAAAPATAHA
ncbi:MAG: hypothetical protein GTO71_07015 [Woeseiaceae bacterium]|nr:hypothetical protein [Woeseiaceae bacterium]NIP20846.1 hypothetical protein [Woeseiaceae bacterium]NIS89639.1 hypothetical protein [Woeseiaceae bacterium]